MIPPPRQGGGSTRAPALSHVVTLGGVVVHVAMSVAGGFVVKCCLVSALLLERCRLRCRLRCRSISAELGTAPSRSGFAFVKSASSSTFNLYERSWAGSTTHRSSWHFHSSHSYRTSHSYRMSHVQEIREFFRLICGQLLLRCRRPW